MLKGRLPLSPAVVVKGLGSGVIIDRDGYIVTNYHVVQDASELAVALADGTLHLTRIVGVDTESDIALLKIDAEGLRPIALTDINEVCVGDVALAVGNPLGIGQTVTQGIISAIVRKGTNRSKTYSDRRGDQSRQLGRRADRHRGPPGGNQRRDSLA
jgi:S1-C subfamily serine protease